MSEGCYEISQDPPLHQNRPRGDGCVVAYRWKCKACAVYFSQWQGNTQGSAKIPSYCDACGEESTEREDGARRLWFVRVPVEKPTYPKPKKKKGAR